MISTDTTGFAALARHLARTAETIAQARTQSAVRKARRDPGRWRDARLLWPAMHEED